MRSAWDLLFSVLFAREDGRIRSLLAAVPQKIEAVPCSAFAFICQ